MKQSISKFLGSAILFLAVVQINIPALPVFALDALEADVDDDFPVDHRFGVVEAFWEPADAAELNVGWDRILFYWNEIQPTGPDDWNTLHVLEEWLVDAQEQDRLVMGLLKNTPPWATDGEPFSGVPRGLYLPVDDPENLWAVYVRNVVEYYAPRGVHNWIIWNEPEIAPDVYGHEFAGTTQDYYQLLKVAYQVAKANDPQAVIHLAGWSYWHDPQWLNTFLSVAARDPEAAANDFFFDTITLHIYFRVETVEQLVQETRRMLERYGIGKPIWINETNASPNLDPGWPVQRPVFQVDLDQQAWYVIQAHALGFGADAASIGVYKLIDVQLPPGGESFGIMRPNRTRRPAFDAYKATVRYLHDFTYPVGRQITPDFYVFSFRRPEEITRILWSRTAAPLTVQVPALATDGLLVSALGETQPLTAVDGLYTIELGGARCTTACDIGGPPVFLVEKGGPDSVLDIPPVDPATIIAGIATAVPTLAPDAATATADAMMNPSPTPTSTPTPSPTPTATATSIPTPTPTQLVPTATLTANLTPTVEPVGEGSSGQTAYGLDLPTGLLFIGAGLALGVGMVVIGLRRRGR